LKELNENTYNALTIVYTKNEINAVKNEKEKKSIHFKYHTSNSLIRQKKENSDDVLTLEKIFGITNGIIKIRKKFNSIVRILEHKKGLFFYIGL
jgi:hypothetical protein